MKKIITLLHLDPTIDFSTDSFICHVKFSTVDLASIGKPGECRTNHVVTITITDILLNRWLIPGCQGLVVTEEMVKVALQFLEDHITQKIKDTPLLEEKLESLVLNTENAPAACPYNLANIAYPTKTTFVVELEDKDDQELAESQVSVGGNISGSTIIIGDNNQVHYTERKDLDSAYTKIERLMPNLLKEMRADLVDDPTKREFVILKHGWIYNSSESYLAYYLDEHENLEGKLQILENLCFIRDVTYNNVRRFVFQEEFVDYLIGI